MTDIEVVIKIPEETYQGIINADKVHGHWGNGLIGVLCTGIAKGTPLPKNHDRLIILSEEAVKREQVPLYFSSKNYWINEVGLSNATIAIIEPDEEMRW